MSKKNYVKWLKHYLFVNFWLLHLFDALTACNCSTKGMDSCTKIGGICNCAIEYSGMLCAECNDGFYETAIENGERTCIGNYEWFRSHEPNLLI